MRKNLILTILIGICFYFILVPFVQTPIDAGIWIENGQQFVKAIKTGDPSKTYVNLEAMHPGVSIMWIVAIPIFLLGSQIDPIYFYYLFSAISILLYGVILKIWPQEKIKIIAGSIILVLILPASLMNGSLTWLDAMSTPLIFLWFILIYKNFKQPTLKKTLLIGVLLGWLLLTRYLYVLLIPIYLMAEFFYNQKDQSKAKFFQKTGIVLITAFLTFILFYPAALVIPETVFLKRLNASYSGQTINPIQNQEIFWPLMKKIFLIHPLINFGFVIISFELLKQREKIMKEIKLVDFLGLVGGIFLMLTYAIIFSLHDAYRGTSGFLTGFYRYILPGVFLLAPYSIQKIVDLKVAAILKKILITLFIFYSLISIPLLIRIVFLKEHLPGIIP